MNTVSLSLNDYNGLLGKSTELALIHDNKSFHKKYFSSYDGYFYITDDVSSHFEKEITRLKNEVETLKDNRIKIDKRNSELSYENKDIKQKLLRKIKENIKIKDRTLIQRILNK
jgi:DNA-binding transcriptional regulator GbsR (MarR family)